MKIWCVLAFLCAAATAAAVAAEDAAAMATGPVAFVGVEPSESACASEQKDSECSASASLLQHRSHISPMHESVLVEEDASTEHQSTPEEGLDDVTEALTENVDQRILQVVVHSLSEEQTMGVAVMNAFQEAGLNADDWVPVGEPPGSMKLTTPLTPPFTYNITVRRLLFRPQSPDKEEDEEETDSHQVEDEAEDEEEHDVATGAEDEDDADEESSVETVSLFEEEEEEESILQRYDQMMMAQKKNTKQKNWAAKMISRLESTVCKRKINGKPAARLRTTHPIWDCQSNDNGRRRQSRRRRRNEQIGLACYEPCRSGENGVWFLCHAGCYGWTDTGSTCNEKCSMAGLDHMSTTCVGLGYCAKSSGECAAKIVKMALSFVDMFANFVPGGKAMSVLKRAAKTGTKEALKLAIKAAVKDVAKELLRKTRKNLVKYIKQEKKTLREETKNAIMQGGAEQVVETMIAKTQSGALKDAAMELVEAVDPTGIVSVVNSFEADNCRDKVMENMPESDLIEDPLTTKPPDVRRRRTPDVVRRRRRRRTPLTAKQRRQQQEAAAKQAEARKKKRMQAQEAAIEAEAKKKKRRQRKARNKRLAARGESKEERKKRRRG